MTTELFKVWFQKVLTALTEVIFVVFFSFVPSILAAAKTATNSTAKIPIFWPTLISSISNGQLLVYTSAILGTIIWLAMPIWQPHRFIFLRSALMVLMSLLVLFVTYIGGFDLDFRNSNPTLITTSIVTYIASLFIYVVLLVIKEPPGTDLAESYNRDVASLEDKYRRDYGG